MAVALAACAWLLRLQFAPDFEADGEALAPLMEALGVPHRGTASPGFGRSFSHLPLVWGQPDGLLGVAHRRLGIQGLLPALVYLAARLRGATPALAAGAGLLLATGDSQIRTLLGGHGVRMAPEWVAVALLCARDSRPLAFLSGVALALAVMNDPLALPAVLLLATLPRRAAFAGTAGVALTLAPAAAELLRWRADGRVLTTALGMNPGLPPLAEVTNRLTEYVGQPGTLLLLLAPALVLALRADPPRPARVALAALVAAALLATLTGWLSQAWWRPLAPWLALVLATARARALPPVLLVVALHAALTMPAEFQHERDTLRRVGHTRDVALLLEERRADGPWSLLGLAEPGLDARSSLRGVVLDRVLAGRADGLFAEGARELRARRLMIHVEGEPPFVARARATVPSELQLLAMGQRTVLVEAESLDVALPWLLHLCTLAPEPLVPDGPAEWQPLLGRRATGPIFGCPGAE